MAVIRVIFLCIVLAAFVCAEKDKVEEIDAKILLVNDLPQLRSQFPNVNLFPLRKSSVDPKQTIRYTLGSRISSDRLAAQGSNSTRYPTLQDVQLQLKYPQFGGNGLTVTFVEILVNQTSSVGNAYVVSGGIGQRSITIAVQAKSTYSFGYKASFYGY